MDHEEYERRQEEQEEWDRLHAWSKARSYDEYRELVGDNRPPAYLPRTVPDDKDLPIDPYHRELGNPEDMTEEDEDYYNVYVTDNHDLYKWGVMQDELYTRVRDALREFDIVTVERRRPGT